MHSYIAIQLLTVRYEKQHRGGAGARARAELPRGLPLPVIAGRGVLHECTLNPVGEPRTRHEELPERADGGTIVQGRYLARVTDGGLALHRYSGTDPWQGGIILESDLDQWVRLITNSGSPTGRWFEEVTINLGRFAEPPDGEVFLGEPSRLADHRRDLLRNGYSER